MSIAAALAELERSPELLDHIAYLKAFVADEHCRREQFSLDFEAGMRAEFIHGDIVFQPPAEREEAEAYFLTAILLNGFAVPRRLGEAYAEKCLVRCQRNDYLPDVCFYDRARCAEFGRDQKIYPPPDLIAEVLSPASENNDRRLKLKEYARHGVGEYWVVDSRARLVEQYILPHGGDDYRLKARLAEGGRLASVVVAGFDVPVIALFDMTENQRVLRNLEQAS